MKRIITTKENTQVEVKVKNRGLVANIAHSIDATALRRAGITLGSKAADAVYLTDANIAMTKAIKDLEAKGF